MLINALSFGTGGHCRLHLEQTEGWLRTTWAGYITPDEAMRGALNYLVQVGPFHNLYLLNDNTGLRGPWFESLAWLKQVWLPQATQLGLRYIAHVVQADTHCDILTHTCFTPGLGTVELQLFEEVAAAEEWLRGCQRPLQPKTRRHSPLV